MNEYAEFARTWMEDTMDVKTTTLKNGITLRSIESSARMKPLLLIHTIRTQADYFQKLIPFLKSKYRIIAIDLPGHGYSSLKENASYDELMMRESVNQFIEQNNLHDLAILGESIGGVLALTVAADRPDLVTNVIAVNPYDYGDEFGGGIRRSSGGYVVGFFQTFGSWTPENRFFLRKVFNGGFKDPSNLTDSLFEELYGVGRRPGFREMEYLVFKNYRSWVQARQLYGRVKAPIQLIDTQFDWSTKEEQQSRRALMPAAKRYEIRNAGHFVSLEKPEEIAKIVLEGRQI